MSTSNSIATSGCPDLECRTTGLERRKSPMDEATPPTPIVEIRGIEKVFGAVQALRNVDLVLYQGQILGLVGDNSAGKSTLMKILTGAYQRDAGEILVAGQPVHFKSPHESRDVGIEMIYQDFALCGNMDVGQNVFLDRWPLKALSSIGGKCTQKPTAC